MVVKTGKNNFFGAVIKFFNEQYGLLVENDGSIYRTTNGFNSSQPVSAPTFAWPSDIEFVKNDGAKIWISLGEQLFFSTDSGLSWKEQQMPPGFDGEDIEFADNRHGWILTSNTVYYTDSGDQVTGIEQTGMMTKEFRLEQNYPNPFNPITTIDFDLPYTTAVLIEVYNTADQRIQTLLNKMMPEGSHQIVFDAGALSSGIYFYRIETGNYQDVKKMVLVK